MMNLMVDVLQTWQITQESAAGMWMSVKGLVDKVGDIRLMLDFFGVLTGLYYQRMNDPSRAEKVFLLTLLTI